uniref:Uncharacterized protein n=1 Tax=Nymphaea colorata TaxID=210225 RepID=A0A5K0XJ14_9MAGN
MKLLTRQRLPQSSPRREFYPVINITKRGQQNNNTFLCQLKAAIYRTLGVLHSSKEREIPRIFKLERQQDKEPKPRSDTM